MSQFLNGKSDVTEKMILLLNGESKAKYSLEMKCIWCDNAGKNKKLEGWCKQDELLITFECTTCELPKKNGKVGRMFPTLCRKMRAILCSCGLYKQKWLKHIV